MATIYDTTHPRGDTFSVTGRFLSGDFTGWTGKSQVRSETDELLSELVFTWIDATTGSFVVQALDTSHWPVGTVLHDVQVTSPAGVVVSSRVVKVLVEKDVTRNG